MNVKSALLGVGLIGAGGTAGWLALHGLKGLAIGGGAGIGFFGVGLWLLGRKHAPAVAAFPATDPIHVAGATAVGSTVLPDGSPNPNKLPGESVAAYKARGGWGANMARQRAARAAAAAKNRPPPPTGRAVTGASAAAAVAQTNQIIASLGLGGPVHAGGGVTASVTANGGAQVNVPGIGGISVGPNGVQASAGSTTSQILGAIQGAPGAVANAQAQVTATANQAQSTWDQATSGSSVDLSGSASGSADVTGSVDASATG